jgi:hypothetical protein
MRASLKAGGGVDGSLWSPYWNIGRILEKTKIFFPGSCIALCLKKLYKSVFPVRGLSAYSMMVVGNHWVIESGEKDEA